MFDKYAHLRKLHTALRCAEGDDRIAARRALMAEAVRLDLTAIGFAEAVCAPAAPEAVN